MSSLTAHFKVGTAPAVLRTHRTRQLCSKVSCTAQPQPPTTPAVSRRNALSWTAVALSTVLVDALPAHAIQGESAGRVPGMLSLIIPRKICHQYSICLMQLSRMCGMHAMTQVHTVSYTDVLYPSRVCS